MKIIHVTTLRSKSILTLDMISQEDEKYLFRYLFYLDPYRISVSAKSACRVLLEYTRFVCWYDEKI